MPRLTTLSASIALLLAPCTLPAQADERVERFPDGAVQRQYGVDEFGRRHGRYQAFWLGGEVKVVGNYRNGLRSGPWREHRSDGTLLLRTNYIADQHHGRHETFHASGKPKSIETYRKGVLHGPFSELDITGKQKRTGKYRDGLLDGDVKILRGTKVLSRQKWKAGLLLRLGKMQPFPRPAFVLRKELQEILAVRSAETPSGDVLYPRRFAALRRLMAYRNLCGVEWQSLVLHAPWFPYCDAAAEACKLNGGLSHHPSKPASMDEARFRLAAVGARSSNLASGPMIRSVDMYMDDSDPSNIDRVGHRRWCLNPRMRKTAFGQSGRYSAMWSFDSSGSAPKGMRGVLYPPAGYTPVDLFGSRHAWSVGILRGGQAKRKDLSIEIFPLDEHYLVDGKALELDYVNVARSGYGTGSCLIFRPVGLDVTPGARYLARIRFAKGKKPEYEYVVEFCEGVGAAR